MQRRKILASTAASAAAALVAPSVHAQGGQPTIRWRMPSSFPRTLDTVFGGATTLVDTVKELTDGRFQITAHGAGEIVPPLAVLDAVQNRTVDCGHTAGFYYLGKEPALAFDTGVPFGMTPRQHSAWMNNGGGLELMREIYAKYNVVQIPCGNTGAQMGGWFRKEIRTPEDFKGLRMRAAGMLGSVYAKLGATPQQLAASDIYIAMEKGTIDAVEWVGPYDDEKLGLHKVAKYYYAPGVMEVGASLCFIVNKAAWAELPPSYKAALDAACAKASNEMLAKYDANNIGALKRILGGGSAKLEYWPRPVMQALQKASEQVLQEQSAKDETFRRVYAKWRAFLDDQLTWTSVNDGAAEQFMMNSRRRHPT